MRIAIFGSNEWDNYTDIMRSMTVFIQEAAELGHTEVIFVHSGKRGAENMITEYIGKTEKFLRQKKFKIKEELFRDRSKITDVKIVESGIDFALVFSTGDGRTYRSKKLLEAYEIPFRLIESA
jgi:hypothetical protein